jgi:hypothetical protein
VCVCVRACVRAWYESERGVGAKVGGGIGHRVRAYWEKARLVNRRFILRCGVCIVYCDTLAYLRLRLIGNFARIVS